MKWLRTLWTGEVLRQKHKPVRLLAVPRLEILDERNLLSNVISLFNVPAVAPQGFANPVGITAGPDGNLWFVDRASHAAGKITPTGVITEYPDTIPADIGGSFVGITAHTIVTGPDGNLWFTDYQSLRSVHTGVPRGVSRSEIVRVTPAGVVTEFNLPDPASGPLGITVGPDGKLWFAEGVASGVGSITTDGTIQEFMVPRPNVAPFGQPFVSDITTGSDGNLWFTHGYVNRVGRLAPNGTLLGEVQLSVPPPASSGLAFDITNITVGPDGNLWVTERNGFGRITPAGTVTEFKPIGSSNFSPNGITVGPDGNLWFTERPNQQGVWKVGSIRPDGSLGVELPIPSSSSGGYYPDITVGPNGTLWFIGGGQIGVVHNYVETLFENVLGRKAAPADLNYWDNLWGQQAQAAASIQGSDVSNSLLVGTWYQKYLGRPVDNDGLGYFVILLRTMTAPQALAQLLASPEYYAHAATVAGGVGMPSDTTFVQALYQHLLGRAASTADVAYWQPQVAAQGLSAVALSFLTSDEYRLNAGQAAVAGGIQGSDEAHARLVGGWYQTYLGRPADAGGLQYFVNLLRTATEEQALAPLFASPEYYAHAAAVAGMDGSIPSDTTFVQALYQHLLGRTAGAAEVAYWQPQVVAQGRSAVALLLLTSDEYRRNAIQNAYQSLLHRSSPVGPAEVNYWLALNLDNQRLKVAFEQTEEFALHG